MKVIVQATLTGLLSLFPLLAQAYIGPGAGLGVIGTVIVLFLALVLLIVGFVWYPAKRFLRRRKSVEAQEEGDSS